jgi:hypothetical protein
VKIEKLVRGMVVWNITIKNKDIFCDKVKIADIDYSINEVLAFYLSSMPKWYPERVWSKWRLRKPSLIKTKEGLQRLMSRKEKAAVKLKQEGRQLLLFHQ